MNDRDTTRNDTSAGPDDAPLIAELLAAVPRFVERTAAQLTLSRTLLAHLPCVGAFLRATDDEPVPEHEARQPTDVLSVVALREDEVIHPGDGGSPSAGSNGGPPERPPSVTAAVDPAASAAPAAGMLPIPEYDSLAASQVVPRLTTLSADELEAVGAYESAHRRRQTILNRVTQLLAD